MPSLNSVQLIGYLGKEPETRLTSTGKNVCHFSVAVHRNGGGEPDWFQVEAWNRLGEICQQYLSKGRLIYLDGRLQTDRWTGSDGEAHVRTKVVAQHMQMLDRKPDEQEVAAEGDEAV